MVVGSSSLGGWNQDESFLVTVSDRAVLQRDFTSWFGEIGEVLTFVRPGGSTSLVDGVYLALSHMRKAHNPRKALVIVSDGGDNNSRYNLRELLRRATENDVLIYTIGICQNPESPEELEGPELLARISQKSGGRSFKVDPGSVGSVIKLSTWIAPYDFTETRSASH